MGSVSFYKNIESDVEAYQLSSGTTNEIGRILLNEAALGMLATLTATYSESTACHTFRFRYKDESTDSTLSATDYLVLLNTGKYVAYTAEAFEAEYINTVNDLQPIQPLNVFDNFIAKMNAMFTDLNFKDRDDATARMYQAVERLVAWYHEATNTVTFDFTNYSMVSSKDINLIIPAFAKATYINDQTQFVLNFNNVGAASRNLKDLDGSTINSFNIIALQELVSELKKIDSKIRKRITQMSFVGTNGAPSAVSSSVTEGQWLDVIDEFRNVTGISRNSAVTR